MLDNAQMRQKMAPDPIHKNSNSKTREIDSVATEFTRKLSLLPLPYTAQHLFLKYRLTSSLGLL